MNLLSGTFLPLHRASETEASYYNPTCLKSKITSQDYFFLNVNMHEYKSTPTTGMQLLLLIPLFNST